MFARYRLLIALVAAVFSMSQSARAEPASSSSRSLGASDPVSYGGQTLAVDGLSVAGLGLGEVLFAAQGSRETALPIALLWGGFGGTILGAPIVHFAHGNVGTGFGSLGLRLTGWTLVGLGAGEGQGEPGLAVLGLGVLGTTVVLDATVFAHEDGPRIESTGSFWIRPMLGRRTGVSFGTSF
jgi:hypothetical protein